MRDRLTDGARRVLKLSAGAADRDGVTEFGPDYVLLGLAHYREIHCGVARVATAVLDNLHVSLHVFARSFGARKPEVAVPRAKPAPGFMDAACAETSHLPVGPGCDYVGTEHLLLAIAR